LQSCRGIAYLELVDVDAAILDRASQPMPTEVGTLDAIHFATALLWKAMTATPITVATHDSSRIHLRFIDEVDQIRSEQS
jgi:hypothetical protein